jgi:hypothetical protein
MRTLSFVVILILCVNSCVSEFEINDTEVLKNKKFILGYISPNNPVRIKYDYLQININNRKKDNGKTRIVLYENGKPFDTLSYSQGEIIRNFLNYNPTYSSSAPNKYPKYGQNYTISVESEGDKKLYDFGICPKIPVIDSITLKLGIIETSSNRIDYGTIYVSKNDETQFLAFGGVHTLLANENFMKTPIERKIKYHLDKANYCGSTKQYIQDEFLISADMRCLKNENKIIRFEDPNFFVEDSLISTTMKVCTIRKDLADFFSNQEVYYEGTEFFFSPTKKLNFTINDDTHTGLLSCLPCKTIPVVLKK